MKIADSESIKAGEQELISSIMKKLDSEIIESMAAKSISLGNLEFQQGDMVIHEDKIVYKLDFEAVIGISLMFDRDGNMVLENDAEHSGNEDEEISELSPTGDISELQAEEEVIPPSPDTYDDESEDEEMSIVLQKTRDFWLKKSTDASELSEMPEDGSVEESLEPVLERNRDYWESQGKMPS